METLKPITVLDEHLSIRDGHLYVEECDTVDLAKTFGTPIFIVSEKKLRDNIRKYKKAFGERWKEGRGVNIMPAIKANYSLALRHILSQGLSSFNRFLNNFKLSKS